MLDIARVWVQPDYYIVADFFGFLLLVRRLGADRQDVSFAVVLESQACVQSAIRSVRNEVSTTTRPCYLSSPSAVVRWCSP